MADGLGSEAWSLAGLPDLRDLRQTAADTRPRTSARSRRRRTRRARGGTRPRPCALCSAASVSSAHGARRHLVERVRRVQEPADAVLDHLGQAADARRHHRHPARHRLERGQAEALLRRRQQEHVAHRQQRQHFLLRAHGVHERARCPARAPCAAPAAARARRRRAAAAPAPGCRMRSKIAITESMRFTGRKFETCTTIFAFGSPPVKRLRRSGTCWRRCTAQSRKLGITSISRCTPSSRVGRVAQALATPPSRGRTARSRTRRSPSTTGRCRPA